jgi:hypothetical protein
VGKSIHWLYVRQRTDNQNIQGAQKPMEEIQKAKKHIKKILTIPGHKVNANQNHTKIPPLSY